MEFWFIYFKKIIENLIRCSFQKKLLNVSKRYLLYDVNIMLQTTYHVLTQSWLIAMHPFLFAKRCFRSQTQ